MNQSSRILPLDGASNFRDLGGYRTTDGSATRWGRLFRSDALHELTEDDVTFLQEMGLKCIIDLRTASEVERTGRGLLQMAEPDYFHLSVIDKDRGESRGLLAPMDESLSNRYLWYLDIGREAFAQALRVVGDASSYPLVFHCAAGKDRSGVFAALVLAILGVERETIVEDYVLTASRMEPIMARLLRSTAQLGNDVKIPPSALTAEPATMERFLDGLDQRYGGARQWALAAGVPHETIEEMSIILVTADADNNI